MNITPFLGYMHGYYYDMGRGPSVLGTFLIALAMGAVVALIAVLIMRGQMNSARHQQDAAGYLKHDSFRLMVKQDTFLYSRVSKTPRPRDTGGHAGGHTGGHGGGPGRGPGGGHGGPRGRF